jgi:hypothetical protein
LSDLTVVNSTFTGNQSVRSGSGAVVVQFTLMGLRGITEKSLSAVVTSPITRLFFREVRSLVNFITTTPTQLKIQRCLVIV